MRGRTRAEKVRLWLLALQDHRCAICTGPLGLYDSHVDHIIPRVAGGSDELTNLQAVHMDCNLRKGASLADALQPDQVRMPWAQ